MRCLQIEMICTSYTLLGKLKFAVCLIEAENRPITTKGVFPIAVK
jgi:hypothetical protein